MARPGAARTTGFEVSAIESTSSGWRVSGTRGTRDFERLVLTYPIHQAVNCLAGVPDQVKQALCGLRYNLMYVVMIAVGNQSLMDKSAIYIPDPEVLPHRVCYMGYFSPSMVRKGSSSLIAEVTMPGNDPRTPRIGRAEALERTISDLARIGIVRQADIVASEIREIEYAYPVYTLDYDANLAVVRDYFVSLGIELLGRFAEFNYINMDEVIRRAMVMADRLNAVCSGQRSAVSFRRSEAEC
jgi:protoporphyrinogen oxidase